MSKLLLKKELKHLTKEQIVEVILSAYGASKEAKEYFDFFIDPNPSQLLEKYQNLIAKELSRVRLGRRSKARISLVRKHLKKFSTFEPGTDYLLSLHIFTINYSLLMEKTVYFSPVLFNGVKKITDDTLRIADKQGAFAETVEKISSLIDKEVGTKYFCGIIRDTLSGYINDPKNNAGKLR